MRTSTVPAIPAGTVAVICVAELTVKPVAAVPPKVTAVTPVKLVPVMVTLVPPLVGPLVGLKDVTVGAADAVVLAAKFHTIVPSPLTPLTGTVNLKVVALILATV